MKLFKRNNYKTEYKIESDSLEKSSERYESLAPSSNIINGQEYFNALDWALEQDDIHNIAISGPYGSGKSSVINSYFKIHPNKKVVKISLAAFAIDDQNDDSKDNPEEREKKESLEHQLESGILKQLLYSVDETKIPKSRYRKSQGKVTIVSNIFYTIMLACVFFILVGFFLPDKVIKFIDVIVDNVGKWLFFTIVTLLLVSLYYFLIWFRTGYRLREVNLFNNIKFEADINDKSVFNKNLNEIINYFEAADKEIVCIEDIDRFDNTNIFVALRELNNIINGYEKIKKTVFIYAIKDDMFLNEGERTKFFDFIIPVVPYISSTNSAEILLDKLKIDVSNSDTSLYDISERFVSMVSPYINDMRNLICICNEFNIFKETLKGNQNLNLNDEKMLALIIFKNLYPKDFSELEDEKDCGIVKTAFINKKRFIITKKQELDAEIEIEKNKLTSIDNETLKNIKEIKALMLGCLTSFKAALQRLDVDNKALYYSDIMDDNFDMNSLKNKRFRITYNKNGSSGYEYIDDLDKFYQNEREDYFARLDYITVGIEESRNNIRLKIEEYENIQNELRSESISKIIQKNGVDFLDEPVRNNDLLVFLLRHGYIDETFENYINYFHPKSVSKDEMNFVLGIRNHRSEFDYTYELSNVERIFDMLQDFEFKQQETLNFNLIDYVLEKKADTLHSDYLFVQLSDRSDSSMQFIKAYIDRNIHIDLFINKLCSNNKYFWEDVITDPGIPQEKEYAYLNYIFRYADVDDIVDLNVEGQENFNILSNYILKHKDIAKSLEIDDISKTISVLDKLDIKFIDFELKEADDRLIEDIYSNNRYVINEKMISNFITWKKPELSDEISKKNYSLLIEIGFEPVLKYVRYGFDEYLNTIILGVETNIHEDKEAIEDIIERSLVNNHSLCVDVISKQTLVWNDISEVGNGLSEDDFNEILDIWNMIFINNRVQCTWENICQYYEGFGMTDTLAEYINMHYERLDSYVTSEIPSDTFLYEILSVPEFEINNFVKLIKSSGIEQYTESIEGLSVDKIKALINEKYLKFDIDVFQEIKTFAPTLVIDYILKNPKEFITKVDLVNIPNSEIDVLLKSDQFNTKEKTPLANMYDLTEFTTENAMTIRDLTFEIERTVTDTAWKLLPDEMRYQLFLNQMDSFSNEELPGIFEQFSEVYHQLIERSNHRYTLPYNDYNDKLTKKLLEREYVTSANKHSLGKKNLFGKETDFIEGRVKQAKKTIVVV